MCQRPVHFCDIDQFFDGENLACDRLRNGLVDGRQALFEAERVQHARGLFGQTDGRAEECNAEVGHCKVVSVGRVDGILNVVLPKPYLKQPQVYCTGY